MNRRLLRALPAVLAAAWALAVGLSFARLEPDGTLAAAPWAALTLGLGVAVGAILACAGGGAALLSRLLPAALDDELGWLRAVAVGLTGWGLLSLPAALLFGVHPWTGALTLAVLATGWLLRPRLAGPRIAATEGAAGLLIAVPALLTLLAPASDTDELYHHLALPARMLREGALLGGPWMPNGSRPLALHLPWAWLLGLGGPEAPRALHLLLALALLLALGRRARAWWGPAAGLWAPLLLAGSATFLGELGLAHADLPCALLALVALDAALAGCLPLVAIAAGGALAVKYTAAAAILPLFLLLLGRALRGSDRWRALGAVLLAGLGTLAVVAPWWLRNAGEGLHPFFPFAGWGDGSLAFQYRDRYGAGRGPLDLLLLPWRVTMAAEADGDVFLGRLQPAFLALLPPALWAAWRDARARWLLAVTLAGALLWWSGIQWLRYLLPVLPCAALVAAAGAARLPRPAGWAVGAAFLLGLPANLRPILGRAAERAPVALGLVSREEWLDQHLDAWPAVRWLNEHGPADASVALLFCWPAWLIERPWTLGSVEEHVPTRALLARHGAGALAELERQGVTHVLVGRVNFVRKTYPFLDDATFEAQFEAPEAQLRALLEREAMLEFEDGRYAVWKLSAP